MKKRSLLLLPLAAALALSGCSGSDTEPSTESTETSAGSSDTGASQEAAAPQASAALSTEQAKSIVTKLAGDSSTVQILDGDSIAASLPQAKAMIEQMEIKPEKCAEFVTQQDSWDIDGINMAVAVLMDETTMASTSYSVAGYEDSSKLEQITEQAKSKDLQGCDTFSMSVAGQEVEASAKILDVTSDADVTYGTVSTMKMNGMDVPGTYQIQGLVGNNAVAVSISASEEESEADMLKELTDELNAAVAEVKAVAK